MPPKYFNYFSITQVQCDNMRAIAAVSRIANSYKCTARYEIVISYKYEKKEKNCL